MSTYTDLLNDIEPKASNEAVIDSIIDKSRIIKRKKIRNLSVTVIVLTMFMAMTITVGAVNDWDYTSLLQRIFNNNQIIADSIENNVNYRVVNNTYDGITFELTGLYADKESLLLVVDITSDKPIFSESKDARGGSLISSLIIASESPDPSIPIMPNFSMNDISYYILDDTRMVAVVFFAEQFIIEYPFPEGTTSYIYPFHEAVAKGKEFALLFGDNTFGNNPHVHGLPLDGGNAEVRFTVDSIDERNSILLSPDLTLADNVLLKEIRLTPFSLVARFDGTTGNLGNGFFHTNDGWETDISLLMSDGEVKPLEYLNNGSGLLNSFSGGSHADYENHSWVASFNHAQLLDLDEVVAIIFYDIEIPVR